MSVVLVVGLPSAAHAGGFYVPEVGPRAVALGGAMAADDQDASTLFHNPAGLAGLAGRTEVQAASGLFLPDVSYFRRPVEDPGTGETLRFDRVGNENAVIVAPWLGAAIALPRRDLELGLGLYAPFGATLEFPAEGAQRHVVTSISLRTIWVGPSLAWQGPGGLRLGASLAYVYGDLALEQANAIPYVTGDPEQFPDPDAGLEGKTRVQGSDPLSFGATLGAQWVSPGGRLVLGLSVTTPVTLEMEGDAVVQNAGITALVDAEGQVMQPAGERRDDVRLSLPLPLVARAGVRARVSDALHLSADVNWQRWSTFESLTIDFVNEYELLPTPGAYLYDVEVVNAWKDTFTVRLGAEARPFAMPLTLRAGALFDQSPVGDRHFALTTPDSDKLGVSAGVGYRLPLAGGRALVVDASFMHLFLQERDVAPTADGMAGSAGTVLNKPAPSFYQGVTRAAFDILYVALTVQL
jgi:long-chain fatty acid transport protein